MTMNTIWKYDLTLIDVQGVKMPFGAELLCVQMQGSAPCLWARVDPNPDMKIEVRQIVTHGTGQHVPKTTGKYLGTYQLHGGTLVFHVFEKKGVT